MTTLQDATSGSTDSGGGNTRRVAQLIIGSVLMGTMGVMLVVTGAWAVSFEGFVSGALRRTLDGQSLTSAGVVVLAVGAALILCVVGVVAGSRVSRWVGLVARLVGIVVGAAAAVSAIWLITTYPGWAITYTALGTLTVYILTLYERELSTPWPWSPLRAQVAKIFALNTKGLNVPRGVALAGLVLLTLVVTSSLHEDRYFLSVAFGLLFVALSDPGGRYSSRLRRMAVVGMIGALVTALGFGIGGGAWGFVVLAIFVATVVSGLVINFGLQALVAGILLNVWLLVTLSAASGLPARVSLHPWNQALAWLIGSAVSLTLMTLLWLLRKRSEQPSPLPEIPGDLPRIRLSRSIVMFVLIRAIAISGAAAIAFGLRLPDADWMPIATLVAMKTTLQQSSFRGAQRLVGAALGAGVAAVFLVTITSPHALEEIVIVLMGVGMSIYAVSYTFYTAVIAGTVLIGMDLPHPTNFAAEGRRVFFTFAGIVIAIVVMVLATLLKERRGPAPAPARQSDGSVSRQQV